MTLVSPQLVAMLITLAALGYVWLLSEARIGSVGATRWRRWFYDPSRLTRMETWPIIPMFAVIGVFLLEEWSAWAALLVAPVVLLTYRYAHRHESPISRAKRRGQPESE